LEVVISFANILSNVRFLILTCLTIGNVTELFVHLSYPTSRGTSEPCCTWLDIHIQAKVKRRKLGEYPNDLRENSFLVIKCNSQGEAHLTRILEDPRTESRNTERMVPRIYTFEMHQDDPSKCTSAKMRRLGFARSVSRGAIPRESIVLNPGGEDPVTPLDRDSALKNGVVVIDCSWAHAGDVFNARFRGQQRRLPSLLAGNPTNYSKLGALSSLEAVAGALYIMKFFEEARSLLSIYKWGETFLTLNQNALDEYSEARSIEDVRKLEVDFFPFIQIEDS
jgi:rRNA small subunit aminocarboxypropyltransferase